MKYIICQKPGEFQLLQKAPPKKIPGEALLRVLKVGICGTDIHAYSGNQAFFTYPRILGHELAAEILEIEDNSENLKTGDKVVVMPYVSCNSCIACRTGKTNCCTHMQVLGVHTDGAMQEVISVPSQLLLPAHNLTDDEIAIVEPLSIGAHAIRRAGVKEGDTILVVGCGPIGIGIIKLAQLSGATVIAMDTNPGRLNFVVEHIGAEFTVQAGPDARQAISEFTQGDMATIVFDATGHPKALETGPEYLSHGGRYVLVGLSKGNLTFNHPYLHAREASILCSRNATRDDFEQVISILGQGNFPSSAYITHHVSFEDMISKFESWLKPGSGVIKAMVRF